MVSVVDLVLAIIEMYLEIVRKYARASSIQNFGVIFFGYIIPISTLPSHRDKYCSI